MRKATYLAFNELDHTLNGVPRANVALSGLPAKAPIFVTWTKHGTLRGCIGTFEPLPVAEGIRKYALIAALQDPRFNPITAKEFPQLEVSVTLLGPLEPASDPLDWKLGKHGVRAEFPFHRSSTFLPDVPVEQGWSKEQTLEELALKAGAMDLKGIKVSKYEGHKSSLSYKEYESEASESK